MRINFINHNGTGFGEPREVAFGATIAGFFSVMFPGESPTRFQIRVNGLQVAAGHILREGDAVSIIRLDQPAQATTPAPAPVETVPVFYIDGDAGGFAGSIATEVGTTLEEFLDDRGVDVTANSIRVNKQIEVGEYVLRANDRVVVTPKNIEGAAMVRVLLVCNDGSGLAEYFEVPQGTTLGNLVAAKTNLSDPTKYKISLNGQSAALASQILSAGDRVSITPNKIQGA